MPFDNYSNFVETVKRFSRRFDDNKINTTIDDCIYLVEADIYREADRRLRVRELEERTTLTTNTSDRFVALPSDYLEFRKLWINHDNFEYDLDFRTPDALNVLLNAPQRPCFYTITDQIEFNTKSDQVYNVEIQYFKELTPLNAANPTNAILTAYPRIYLYGVLAYIMDYAREDTWAAKNFAVYNAAIADANENYRSGNYGPNPTEYIEPSEIP